MPNSSFSVQNPNLQLAVDSTSFGEFKVCPRRYYYSMIKGYAPRAESPHLRFGILLHQARERYEKNKAQQEGVSHDDLLDDVLDWALKETWNSVLGRPWISDHQLKNRRSLIQTIVWYLDALAQDDPFKTVILANGKPAVELSFRFDSGLRSREGEAFIFCGHLDRIAEMNGYYYIPDIKTSSSEPSEFWARQFSPSNQFSLYDLAGKVAFSFQIEGLVVDGLQIGVGFARFRRHLIPRSEAMRTEWLADAQWWIAQMEVCATRETWPMNDKACGLYGGCPFQQVCAKSPAMRETTLEREYAKRVWDPLQVRGE